MDIKPIRTEEDYRAVMEEINRLFDAEPGTPDGDQLEVLVTLVEVYEKEHYNIPLPDPIEAIKYHMERLGLSSRELEQCIGSRTRVWEILNRKRRLSMRMIRNLHQALGLSLDVLMQDYELDKTNSKADENCSGLWLNSELEETIKIGSNSGIAYIIAEAKVGKPRLIVTSEAKNTPQNKMMGLSDKLKENFIVRVVCTNIEDKLSDYPFKLGEPSHWQDMVGTKHDEAATNATLVNTLQ